ncbi:MAG: hypothetical protein ONB44_16495 [candidate division KSB1 bacterium]|nr:hypothetical protein [candidate division KSB1 bacterium]MDZ7303734.1 hypothetical protein [candidate division KSB1 bacterium]MDZ7313129.1 hypothetical protein [candidate division KSB1 bacterium]
MTKPMINIFTMPQEFPCGAGSSCCGPIGQTEEELQALKQGLENALDVPVQTFNVKNGTDMKAHRQILALLRSFGWGVLPIIAVGEEVVSMGAPTVEQAAEAIRQKLNGVFA